jgi:5'-phosphate synthase pdxT subunit
LILAAKKVEGPKQKSFGWIDATVTRNAYGRQLDSFEALDDQGEIPLIFIRAPRIAAVGPEVQVLAKLGGEPIFIRQGMVFGASFHPELTSDPRIHRAIFGPRRSFANERAVVDPLCA